MYQPPPQKKRGSSPSRRSQAASSRTRREGSPSVGRACDGLVQWVWCPSGPPAAASRARSSHVAESSASCGGRMSAAMRKPPGRAAWNAEKRRHVASSSGRSTWQDTTAYRLSAMCGICGLLAPSGAADPSLVARMNEALVHRGPDEGSVDAFGRCVLGHRRLQVIDLATGSQPVASEDGRVVCVFNGELYNFTEL